MKGIGLFVFIIIMIAVGISSAAIHGDIPVMALPLDRIASLDPGRSS